MERIAIGLDLGQTTDYSALSVIMERTTATGEGGKVRALPEPTYDVPWLQRWDLGTPYPAIVAETVARARALLKRFPGALVYLVVDGTGVGRPVVDMLAAALGLMPVELVAIVITGGNAATFGLRDDGAQEWHIPKRDLVGAMQVLFQASDPQRLAIARGLKHAGTLTEELKNFRMKFTAAANAQYEAWREGDHDDLVLAVALPSWALLFGPLGTPFEAAVGGSRPQIEPR